MKISILLWSFLFLIPTYNFSFEDPLLSIELARKEYLKGHYDKATEVLMEIDAKTSDPEIRSLIYLEMAYVKYLMGYKGFSCRFYLKKALQCKPEIEGVSLYKKEFIKILAEVRREFIANSNAIPQSAKTSKTVMPVKKNLIEPTPKEPEKSLPEDESYKFDIVKFEKHYQKRLAEIEQLQAKISSLNRKVKRLRSQKVKSNRSSVALKDEQQKLRSRSLKAEDQIRVLNQQIEQMKKDQEVLVERIVAAKVETLRMDMEKSSEEKFKKMEANRSSDLNSLEILKEIWKREKPSAKQKLPPSSKEQKSE